MKKKNLATRAVHSSEKFGENGSLNVPIFQNSTYEQKIPGEWEQYTYTRTNNPTEEALRHAIADLENGEFGVIFSSGLAAINGVMELFKAGDHVISTDDIYGGSHRLFSQFIEKRKIEISHVDTTDVALVLEAIRPNTRCIYVETPSNPLLKIADIAALSKVARDKGILLVIDNTMATPCLQLPLELGADIVIHSTSKYISGHTNVIGGAVVVKDKELFDQLKFIRKATGANPGPFDCYLTMLGIKTLPLRIKQHCENALRIAQYLQDHKKVKRVYYPGLSDHPQHTLAKAQMCGFGGLVSFDLDGDEKAARAFLDSLDLFALTVSFGSVVSLKAYPAAMSHKDLPRQERIKRGFSDSLIRLSIGIENVDDLLEDIKSALDSN